MGFCGWLSGSLRYDGRWNRIGSPPVAGASSTRISNPRRYVHCPPVSCLIMFDPLRIEGEDGGLVASDQEEGRHVSGQRLQPSHVQCGADSSLARHRQRPVDISIRFA